MTELGKVTELLTVINDGNQATTDELLSLVEKELHRMAHQFMCRENSGHTLQTTALVHEAYLKLVNQRNVNWQNRNHFFAIASKIMRRILINHACRRNALKRGRSEPDSEFEPVSFFSEEKTIELIALDRALKTLENIDELKSRIVELRYFGGLTIGETAAVLNISESKVSMNWNFAKSWLAREIRG